jgi:type 1 glutamine amidotransferase
MGQGRLEGGKGAVRDHAGGGVGGGLVFVQLMSREASSGWECRRAEAGWLTGLGEGMGRHRSRSALVNPRETGGNFSRFPRRGDRNLDRHKEFEFDSVETSLKMQGLAKTQAFRFMNRFKMVGACRWLLAAVLTIGAIGWAAPAQGAPKKVLVVTVTLGFRHSSIPTAERVLADLARESSAFTVEYARVTPTDPQFKGPDGKPDKDKVKAAITEVLAEKMNPAALKKYDAIIFANTTGDLPLPDKEAFLDWIKSGKGFVGMHSATDTFPGFPGYTEMIGGHFKKHAAQLEVQPTIVDSECPICAHFGKDWKVYDEIYQMKDYDPTKVHELLTLNHKPDVKDPSPGHYPIAWCKEYGKGRVFYTSLGHREDVWDPSWPDRKNPKEVAEAYQKHILAGIKWALGLVQMDAKPQKGAVE